VPGRQVLNSHRITAQFRHDLVGRRSRGRNPGEHVPGEPLALGLRRKIAERDESNTLVIMVQDKQAMTRFLSISKEARAMSASS
jgi:hypothetical protein